MTKPVTNVLGEMIKRAMWLSASLVAVAFGAIGAASAQTKPECSQDYVAKTESESAQSQSEKQPLNTCLAVASAPAETSDNPNTAAAEVSQLAKKTQNPIGDLISVPFQNNTNFGFGPHRGAQDVLNIQPVIPIHVTSDWNVITRTILPLVWSPSLSSVRTVPFGTAPTSFSAFVSPREPTNGWLWGFGPVAQIPTMSSSTLGSREWGGGPTAVIVHMSSHIVAGALANNVWSFGGTSRPGDNRYETFLAQPFFNYNFDKGWYAGTSPIVTANWQAKGEKWTVPVGANVGRVIRIGDQPVNLLAGAYYNVVTPTYGGEWQLRTHVTLIF
jgi:hypothetical protein